MNRLNRYRDSLNKFIKDRSCLLNAVTVPLPDTDPNINVILQNKIKNSDLILPILFLTIMNSQNKKNNVSIQGYFTAASMEFMSIIIDIMENKGSFVNNYGIRTYEEIIHHLIMATFKSIQQNLNSIKNSITLEKAYNMHNDIMNIYFENFNNKNILSSHIFTLSDRKPHDDLSRWYFKNNQEYKDKYNKIIQIQRESFNNYVNKKLGSLVEIVMTVGWIMGCGDDKYLHNIKKISKYFAMFYKLFKDFNNLEVDLDENLDGVSSNYVINYGLQDSYEIFMYNKQKFIQECMMIDIYTGTIKEIVNFIDKNVENIIDQTSPDLKSNFSNFVSTDNNLGTNSPDMDEILEKVTKKNYRKKRTNK